MSVKIPKPVMEDLRAKIYIKLDEVNYMSQSRQENGRIMEHLTADPEIGGKIAEFTGKAQVKTYIKDAVINRYAKERTKPPKDLSKVLSVIVGEKVSPYEGGKDKTVNLYRATTGLIVVASCGRLLKWESALRKLLEFMGKNRDRIKNTSAKKPVLILILMSGGKIVSEGDRKLLSRALEVVGVKEKVI